MVFFTCTHCGEALKKPRVEKHFQFQCRNSISVSCMDCFKDFRGQEYVAHTKCITEAERYGGKDFVARPSKNKGERKQQDWILVVQSVIETSKNLSSAERNILNILSSHENVPRKKAKFFNFIKSVLAGRVNMTVVESVWGKMEEALKKASENKAVEGNSEGGTKATEEPAAPSNQASVVENENNENLSKEYQRAQSDAKQNGKSEGAGGPEITSEATNNGVERRSKKSKKRKVEEGLENSEEKSSNSKSKSGKKSEEESTCLMEVEQNGTESKRSKKRKVDNGLENLSTEADESQDNCKDIAGECEASITKFDWSDAILKIVRSKEEISLKKLRKKVLAEYQTGSNKTTTDEKAAAKFDKKLSKITQIVVTNGKVKLVA